MALEENLEIVVDNTQPEKKKKQKKNTAPSPVQQDVKKGLEEEIENIGEVKNITESMNEDIPKKEKKTKKKNNTSKKGNDIKDKPANETTLKETDFLNKLLKKKKVNKKESFSVTLWEDLDNIIKNVQDITGEKQNSIINHILSEAYDVENKTFKLDIPAEVKQNDKATSYLIEEKHFKAIKKTANKLNMSAASYFNKLILKYAQEYILPDIEKKKTE